MSLALCPDPDTSLVIGSEVLPLVNKERMK